MHDWQLHGLRVGLPAAHPSAILGRWFGIALGVLTAVRLIASRYCWLALGKLAGLVHAHIMGPYASVSGTPVIEDRTSMAKGLVVVDVGGGIFPVGRDLESSDQVVRERVAQWVARELEFCSQVVCELVTKSAVRELECVDQGSYQLELLRGVVEDCVVGICHRRWVFARPFGDKASEFLVLPTSVDAVVTQLVNVRAPNRVGRGGPVAVSCVSLFWEKRSHSARTERERPSTDLVWSLVGKFAEATMAAYQQPGGVGAGQQQQEGCICIVTSNVLIPCCFNQMKHAAW